MGLENGIILVTKHDIDNFPEYVNIKYNDVDDEYDVCYWRKCGNLRNEILDAINAESDTYEFELSTGDIQDIIDILAGYFHDISYWDMCSDSIWSFKEMIPQLAQQIVNLEWLMDYMKENPSAEVWFYDSY